MTFLPKSEDLHWTQHSLKKLRRYNLSVSRIKRVLRFPKRKEIGIAPDTVAAMQAAGSKKRPYEIWVMYQEKQIAKNKSQITKSQDKKIYPERSRRIKIISAWRYPGVSPIHEPPPIPDEVWEVLLERK